MLFHRTYTLVDFLHLIIFFFLNHQFKIPTWDFCVFFHGKKSIFSIDISNELQGKSSEMTLHFFGFIEMSIY